MLIVLVALNRNAGQRRIAANVVRFAQEPVPRRKSALEQLQKIDLAARHRKRVEVEVVNVNVACTMRFGMLGTKQKLLIVLLRTLRTVLQHHAHGRVAVDIRIVALQIAVLRITGRDFVENVHQRRILLAHLRAIGAIQNVRFRDVLVSRMHQRQLYRILDLFDARNRTREFRIQIATDFGTDFLRRFVLAMANRLHRTGNRFDNLVFVIGSNAAVPLHNFCHHIESTPDCVGQKMKFVFVRGLRWHRFDDSLR